MNTSKIVYKYLRELSGKKSKKKEKNSKHHGENGQDEDNLDDSGHLVRQSDVHDDDSDEEGGRLDESIYGKPLDQAVLEALMPLGEGGLVWHATLIGNDCKHPKSTKSTKADGTIKPRRSNLPVKEADFFQSIVQTSDGRWVFSGCLNGWPGLSCLELLNITVKRKSKTIGYNEIVSFWDNSEENKGKKPKFPTDAGSVSVRVTLRMPTWSFKGWSAESPGKVWWFYAQRFEPTVYHGEDIVRNLPQDLTTGRLLASTMTMPTCTLAHVFAHRYAKVSETAKDLLTYHAALLLEWDHGKYCTIVELAILNGVGARAGRVNWFHDKLEEKTLLFKCMPSSMILPWINPMAEIRCHDIEAKNLGEFQEYLAKYTGPELRYLDPAVQYSAPVRLSSRSQTDIGRYLLNYMGRDHRYTEEARNCQTFAADFFSFLCGKKNVETYHKVCQIFYSNRSHLFMYDSDMYDNPEYHP